jgi:hypothetical protein
MDPSWDSGCFYGTSGFHISGFLDLEKCDQKPISYGYNAGLKHGKWTIQAVKMLGLTNVCRRKWKMTDFKQWRDLEIGISCELTKLPRDTRWDN